MKYERVEVGYNLVHYMISGGEKKPVYINIYQFGIFPLIAPSRRGKSAWLKDVITKLFYISRRPIIIFDINNEWNYCLSRPNWNAENPLRVIGINKITNYAIKISDVDTPEDWKYIYPEMTRSVAEALCMVATKGWIYHQDDPDEFFNICKDFPVSKEEMITWKERYPEIDLGTPDFTQVKKSLIQKTRVLKERFYGSSTCESNGTIYIDDWVDEIKNSKLTTIDMQIKSYKPDAFECFMVGKILEYLCIYLEKIKPIIVFEEGDYVCGMPIKNMNDEKNNTKSADMILFMAKKVGKKGVFMFILSQNDMMLHYELRRDDNQGLFMEIGESDNKTKHNAWIKKVVKYKSFNLLKGNRPFLLYDTMRGIYMSDPIVIKTNEPCCTYETQGVDFNKED